MKIVKNKYLVLRALRTHYSDDGGVAYTTTTRELAALTGLKEPQTLTAGRKLVEEKLVREVQSKKTVKSGSSMRNKPVVGFVMTVDGASRLEEMEQHLRDFGVEL
jgi:hypothetical protein